MLVSTAELYSQAPLGEIDEIYYLPGMDTVFVTRSYGEWWFGITGGVNGDLYFSDFYLPERPYLPLDTFNVLIDFPVSLGSGLFFGLTGDWLPPGERWGASINIFLLDYRTSSVESEPYKDSVRTRYQSAYDNTYITISPSARYNSRIEGLHFFGGFDVELNINSDILHRKTFDHSSVIDHDIKFDSSGFSSRFGFHLGAGYDILIADINKNMRMLMTPYVSLHGGTSAYTDYGSSRNQLMLRAGVSFKLGFDRIESDTMLFDPNYRLPGAQIASVKMYQEENALPDISVKQDFEFSELSAVQIPKSGTTIVPSSKEVQEEADARKRQLVTINPNETRVFSYNSGMPDDLELYLNSIVAFMEENPGARINVVGHTYPFGTPDEEQAETMRRAEVVKRYLIKKGLGERQVLASGAGSLRPLPNADNRTQAGRAKNRRIEISIIP